MRTLAALGIVSALLLGPTSAQSGPYEPDPAYGDPNGYGAPDGEMGPDGEVMSDEGLDGTPGFGPPVVYGAPGGYVGPPIHRGPHFGGDDAFTYRRGPGVFPEGRAFPGERRHVDRDFGDTGHRGGVRPDGQDGKQRQFGERRPPQDGQFQGGRGGGGQGNGEAQGQRRRRNPDAGRFEGDR